MSMSYSYEKLGFTSGQTLKAEHLNHMEDGIANSSWYDIKDKPFGEVETVVNEPLNITWDGNPDGLDELVYAESGGHYFFKVSSHVLTDEQIKLATINAHFPDAPVPIGEAWNNMLKKGYVTEGAVYAFYAVFVRKAGAEVNGAVFPEAGVYAAFNNGYYTYSITTTEPIEQTKTVVKKIDEKYLPDSVKGGGGMFVTVRKNDAGEYVADRAYEEVYASIVSGQNTVVCLDYRGELYILYPYLISNGLNFTLVISGGFDASHTVTFNTDGTITVTVVK